MKKKVLVLGGAGFIGSNIVQSLLNNNYKVCVIDGLIPDTGGRVKNLETFIRKIDFINQSVEKVKNLKDYIEKADIVIDCMAWTSHRLALDNPIFDLALNAASHLHLIKALKDLHGKSVIYLGSRGQYGKPSAKMINENTPMNPLDIQGIHKLAGESYFRIYSKLYDINAVSLRIPNCFGPNQPFEGLDIGLIGSFIKDALANKSIEVYGKDRQRSIIYVNDVCKIILKLMNNIDKGFVTYNVSGYQVKLDTLASLIVSIVGKGTYVTKDLPEELAKIDIGDLPIDQKKLTSKIGKIENTNLSKGLMCTINYFKTKL